MYKAAIAGLGQIGLMYDFDPKRVAPASHTLAYKRTPDIQLIAAMDSRTSQEQYLNKLSPETKFYDDLVLMLRETKPDVVSVCTPPEHRLKILKTIVAEASPKIIFCEKPVALDVFDAKKILEFVRSTDCLVIPNLSRRWLGGMTRIKEAIDQKIFGELQKVHVKYTRGIFNTGSHIFDLIHWFVGAIDTVQVIGQVYTTADKDNDPSYDFLFKTINGTTGYAESFNDEQYYMFELDLYFAKGKVEIRESGNRVVYFEQGSHPLFSGFHSLHAVKEETNLLQESTIANAIQNIIEVLNGNSRPACDINDGLSPLFVADALQQSHVSKTMQKVKVKTYG
ncbi:hypothetical protein ASG89_29045 [Paenibacillus sp. Soil766]|uniref:Gfo/Idh/MocA family protein n=1 Tax=Paenibacillus sp. Soil766 TaxID=1736404 RepID=UPI000708E728|nr:Gfo/Idh/MocA family oxidoreductase [Paenibacillus sp. Soil766]KRE97952.1 hypothetical protein ASG89_29045 [Paenibacillus sp. Soil766]